eukprot:CAMPEP_0180617430 /NCGR_PEP_ID=MMETSP1037_2-20121125/33023_1 /TAXON_ID=632150 /ORGANISM="Azadinium spinosum, Strain 3D9" /LENGTH=662 /DNA_ID=CAMNT_0022637363 /DNA_START=18 /DNA_END=2006 /DNA_ORIENTATION=-
MAGRGGHPGYSRHAPPPGYGRGPPMQGPSMWDMEANFDRKLADIVQQVQANLDSIETRLAKFESLAETQQQIQVQLLQLNEVAETTTTMKKDIAMLRGDHRVLGVEQAGLLGAGVVEVSQLHQRRRVCSSLGLLCTALDHRGSLRTAQNFLGDRGVSLCSLAATCTTCAALKNVAKTAIAEVVSKSPQNGKANPASLTIDREQWNKVKEYEPSTSVLDKWAESVTVHTALGHLGIEGTVGKAESMKFNSVLKVFDKIDLSSDRFVTKFTQEHCDRDTPAKELDKAAREILRMFAARHPSECMKESINCRDLYRLLEIVGYPLKRFKAVFNGNEGDDNGAAQSSLRFGSYKVRRQICQTMRGVSCYLGEHVSDFTRVAVKWPVPKEEVATMKEILKNCKGCLGLPALLASGDFEGQPYIVTELLGSSMNKVFHCLHNYSGKRRWQGIKILGRLSVRRLRAFHTCGYVHNDISPENILLGPVRGSGPNAQSRLGLYLIDFEHAQKTIGGKKLEMDRCSAEWSSVRSAEGGEPVPQDDLEALGWVLLNGLIGALPWFDWLVEAYKDWDSKWTRHAVVRQVQSAKTQLLEKGWMAMDWKEPATMRAEVAAGKLLDFIKACRLEVTSSKQPRYDLLISLLGGNVDLTTEEAEKFDLEEFERVVVPML